MCVVGPVGALEIGGSAWWPVFLIDGESRILNRQAEIK